MAIVLENLHVECYRGLENLDLNGLNHVNILVGDNNAGKTSLMEIITILGLPLSLEVWNEIARKKTETSRGVKYFYAYRNIFPIDKDKRIAFSGVYSDKNVTSVSMQADEYRTTISEKELNRLNGLMRTGNQKLEETYVDTSVLELTLVANEEKIEFEIYDFQRRPPRILNSRKNHFDIDTVFIEPRDGLINDFSLINKVILDAEYHEQLVEILKEFDSEITGIISVEEMGTTAYYVRTTSYTNAIPISVYGDGLKKALIIFSALISIKGGILLIDEVETSIHFSAMKKVLNSLISWAKKLNVQLFLSTHSKEALNMLFNDDSFCDDISIFTLYKDSKKNYVRKLGYNEAIELQNKQGIEIR